LISNDILRSLRYILNINESKMSEIIALTGLQVSRDELVALLKYEDEPGFKNCSDKIFIHFLNGLINYKRGIVSGKTLPPAEKVLSNNGILKKIRIAFELKEHDIITLIEKSGLKIAKAELNAFFRQEGHRNYRPCGDQFLRNLLKGMASSQTHK
jgi:uncharacterized protein YehS (DUF1456 family)